MNRSRPIVTTLLIVANVLAFAYEFEHVGQGLFAGAVSGDSLAEIGALRPYNVTAMGEYWRIVTSGFLHGSALHLAFNMYSLYALGPFIETVAGTKRMAFIYGISLVGAGLAIVYFGDSNDVTVGASGAIFGLLGALFAIGLKLGRPGMQLVRANIGVLLLNLLITFTVPGISRWGHIGGLIVGFVVAFSIFTPRRDLLQTSATGIDL